MKQKYFIDRKNEVENEIMDLRKKSNIISMIRLLNFVLLIVSIFYIYNYPNSLLYLIPILLLALFIFLVIYHSKISKRIEIIENKIKVLKKYIGRYNNEWKEFKNNGEEYLNDKCIYAKDLDIFGKASIYQYITIANTKYGKDELAKLLEKPKDSLEEITKRQNAVEELSHNMDFSLDFQTYSNLFGKHSKDINNEMLERVLEICEEKSFKIPSITKVLSYIVPLVTIIVILLTALNIIPLYLVGICIVLQLLALVMNIQNSNKVLTPISGVEKVIKQYKNMLEMIDKESFKSELLLEVKNDINENGNCIEGIKNLETIVSCINIRSNSICYVILNCLFMWDVTCIRIFNQWKQKYGNYLRNWVLQIGKIEAYISLGIISQVKSNTCLPQILTNKNPIIKTREVYHPLISQDIVVGNDLNADNGTYIITGSNMSGKTTFMRTVALNLVLMNAGASVCANEFSASIMQIYTSMRLQDDVTEGISSFYAEIKRIKEIIQESNTDLPKIILIDEIFKGTNSADRIICAEKIIRKLNKENIINIITTHDFELCSLEKDKDIKVCNYHFSEYYENDKIKFDYIIKNGRCKTTNAQVLMKIAGIT